MKLKIMEVVTPDDAAAWRHVNGHYQGLIAALQREQVIAPGRVCKILVEVEIDEK